MQDKDGKDKHEDFVKRVMDAKLHLKEKNCADEALQKNIIDTQIKQNQADKAIEDYQAMLSEVDKKKEKLNQAAKQLSEAFHFHQKKQM